MGDTIIYTLFAIAIAIYFIWRYFHNRVIDLTIPEIIKLLPEETEEHILRTVEYLSHSDFCCGHGKGFNVIIAPYYLPKSKEDPTICRLIRHLPECKECGRIDDGDDRGDGEKRYRVKFLS